MSANLFYWEEDDWVDWYWDNHDIEGGPTNVEIWAVFGIGLDVINGCCNIYSSVGLLLGSRISILVIKLFALSDITTWSGNVY